MDTQKPNPGCNTEVDSTPHDVNDNGYDEKPAKYMANPLKGFVETVTNILKGLKK